MLSPRRWPRLSPSPPTPSHPRIPPSRVHPATSPCPNNPALLAGHPPATNRTPPPHPFRPPLRLLARRPNPAAPATNPARRINPTLRNRPRSNGENHPAETKSGGPKGRRFSFVDSSSNAKARDNASAGILMPLSRNRTSRRSPAFPKARSRRSSVSPVVLGIDEFGDNRRGR
jgi:hypothetical protein